MSKMIIVIPVCQAVLCKVILSLRQKKKQYIYSYQNILPYIEPSGKSLYISSTKTVTIDIALCYSICAHTIVNSHKPPSKEIKVA